MRREDLVDLNAFIVVAEEQSFTRAAGKLGTSQSALSHTVRRLEERLGVRLLMRTTRKVAPTDAGERLLTALRPSFDDIDSNLAALSDLRDKPAGTIRITSGEHAADTILWPALKKLLPAYPDVAVELVVDQSLTDLITGRFDAGVRLGEQVAKDMIAAPIGPDLRMIVVGAPSYFADRPKPRQPQDLTDHNCINIRLPTYGGFYPWEFEKGGREVKVRVSGQFVATTGALRLKAALAGLGLAYVFEDLVREHIKEGRLIRVLSDWTPPFSGYHLYYPSRRQLSPALALLVEALRYRKGRAYLPRNRGRCGAGSRQVSTAPANHFIVDPRGGRFKRLQ